MSNNYESSRSHLRLVSNEQACAFDSVNWYKQPPEGWVTMDDEGFVAPESHLAKSAVSGPLIRRMNADFGPYGWGLVPYTTTGGGIIPGYFEVTHRPVYSEEGDSFDDLTSLVRSTVWRERADRAAEKEFYRTPRAVRPLGEHGRHILSLHFGGILWDDLQHPTLKE